MSDTRLVDIETRIAYQDDMLRTLNDALGRQQMEIIRLERRIETLQSRLATLIESVPRELPADEIPPHY